jgi:CRP/FNR family transcriptional regulator
MSNVNCRNCAIYPVCFSIGLQDDELHHVDELVETRTVHHKGDSLFSVGSAFLGVYIVRSGSFKVYDVSSGGTEHIIGFYLPGELIGFDAANTHVHKYDCIALETSSVCRISLEKLFALAAKVESLQQQLFHILGREMSKGPFIYLNNTAEQKLCKFLLSLSEKFQRRGASATQFQLSMTRDEVGVYLGLAAETVGRLLKQLQEQGVLKFHNRDIEILDLARLQKIEQEG